MEIAGQLNSDTGYPFAVDGAIVLCEKNDGTEKLVKAVDTG